MKKLISLFKTSAILKEKTVFYTGFKGNILKSVLIMIFSFSFFTGNANPPDIKRFDLAFGGVTTSELACDLKELDVNIVNIHIDTVDWLVEYLRVYIDYTGDIEIDEGETSKSLEKLIGENYTGKPNGSNPPDPIVTFVSGRISIIANKTTYAKMQKIGDITDLITIFFSGDPTTSANFSFEYIDPKCFMNVYQTEQLQNSEIFIAKQHTDQGYVITQSYNFPAMIENYDLAFGAIDDCKMPQVDVSIVNIDNEEWKVKNLEIYIDYTNAIIIDELKTRSSLHLLLQSNYESYPSNQEIVIFEPGRISIEAKLRENGNAKSIDDIKSIITIFFSGAPSTHVDFSFPDPEDPISSMKLYDNILDCYVCSPKEDPNAGYDIIRAYDFEVDKYNYDLTFKESEDPLEYCDLNEIDVIVNSIESDKDWEVKHVSIHILYAGNIEIDEDKTSASLNQLIQDNFIGVLNQDLIEYPVVGRISIEAQLMENPNEQPTIEDISNLITIFFKGGLTATNVVFSFSQINPKSLMLLDDGSDCIICNPLQLGILSYLLTSPEEVAGKIFTLSNNQQKGTCEGDPVSYLEGAEVNYFNMDINSTTPFCTSITNETGDFSCYVPSNACTKRITPEMDICDGCGLNPLDLFEIQQLILGSVQYFDYAYQTFVADMNGNGMITTMDMIIIQKILLDIPVNSGPEFKFIPKNIFESFELFGMYGLGVPSYDPYVEFVTPPSLYDTWFYGFKSGDVEKTDFPCDHCVPVGPGCYNQEGNANNDHTINIDGVEEKNDAFYAPVTTINKDSFGIIGVTFQVEPIGIELDTIWFFDSMDEMPGYNYDKTTGIIKIMWMNKNIKTPISSNTNKLFTMVFDKGAYSLNDLNFTLIENNTLNESIKHNRAVYNTILEKSITPRSKEAIEFSISPTVFENKIMLNYYSTTHSIANISLYNCQGKLFVNREIGIHKGDNSLTIDRLQIVPEGIVFYKFKIEGKEYSGKLVKNTH